MNKKRLSDKMKQEAVSLGLCAQWTSEWKDNTSKDEMVEKFITGLDFCIQHNFPSTDVMKKHFGDVIHAHGVYVDEMVYVSHPKTVVLNGHCRGTICCDGFDASNIYVRHDTNVTIRVNGHAYVHVSMYDKSKINISCAPSAKCFVYRYGGDITTAGHPVIRDRTAVKE